MLGDADAVAVGDFGNGDAALDRRVEVDVVGPDARGDRQLQVSRLADPLRRQVRRPEGLGDDHVGVRQLALELGIRPILVGSHQQGVTALLQEPAQPELAGHATQQLARLEVDSLRGRRDLAVVVLLDLGDVVACVRRRIAIDRIVVEHAEELRHVASFVSRVSVSGAGPSMMAAALPGVQVAVALA